MSTAMVMAWIAEAIEPDIVNLSYFMNELRQHAAEKMHA